jgi:hypothetical protein
MKNSTHLLILIATFAFLFDGCKKEAPAPPPELPEITTRDGYLYEDDGYSYALTGGTIISDGGSPIISSGVCWSTTHELPTISDFKYTTGTPTDMERNPSPAVVGSFSYSISPLPNSTTYYIRAFATNIVGTAYGNQVSITTPCFWRMAQIVFEITYPKNGDVVPPNLTLTWQQVLGIINYGANYDIYLDNDPNPTTKIASGLSSSSFTITGLSPGTTYYWKVFGWAFVNPCNNLTSNIYHFTTTP